MLTLDRDDLPLWPGRPAGRAPVKYPPGRLPEASISTSRRRVRNRGHRRGRCDQYSPAAGTARPGRSIRRGGRRPDRHGSADL